MGDFSRIESIAREAENLAGEISRSRSYSLSFSIARVSLAIPFSKLFLLIWLSMLLLALPREIAFERVPYFEAVRAKGFAVAEF